MKEGGKEEGRETEAGSSLAALSLSLDKLLLPLTFHTVTFLHCHGLGVGWGVL